MIRPLVEEVTTTLSPEGVIGLHGRREGVVLLRSAVIDQNRGRYSFITTRPFLVFRSFGARIILTSDRGQAERYGNPWHILNEVMARYEMLDEIDLPFPLGGCFGFWGYDLKNFVEPKLKRTVTNDLELPDSWVGFFSSVIAFDHWLGKTWVIATGLVADGSRSLARARADLEFWKGLLSRGAFERNSAAVAMSSIESTVSKESFVQVVRRAQHYIRLGHIYQVNLSHRLSTNWPSDGWVFFTRLREVSPAPYAAYLHCGDFELCSSSPEMFLRMSGAQIQTRPIKGTRPRGADPTRDAQLSYELQTSPKEISELVMITDLLRNDLGRVCEFGSIQVPDLVRLERYAQVQHLVSTVEGRLRPDVTHFAAFSSCFPGGSVSGAPKIRAMEIIDELEKVARGPYTGALGYLGFNQETQLSIIIRTAICRGDRAYFHVGAGIVADSVAEAEYDETLAKAAGFVRALGAPSFKTATVTL
jgi:para-aminobenzoate synthetase component 1